MRVAEIQTLYAYNAWANTAILAATRHFSVEQFCAPAGVPWGSLRGTLVHTLDTEWQGRALVQRAGQASPLQEGDFPDSATLCVRWREEQRAMAAYLAELTDDDLVAPFNLGARGALPLWELLVHLITHGTQHRSEAAMLLTDAGHSPGDLDYFYFALTRASTPTG